MRKFHPDDGRAAGTVTTEVDFAAHAHPHA